jgi:hypothetical protein
MSETTHPDNNDQPIGPEFTDAQWAADEAARALRAGRYRLAASFARLAADAERYATENARLAKLNAVPVPLVGKTRDERPRPQHAGPEWTPDRLDRLNDMLEAETGALSPEAAAKITGQLDAKYASLVDEQRVTHDGEWPAQLRAVPNDDPEATAIRPFDQGAAAAAQTEIFGAPRVDQLVTGPMPSPRRCRTIVINDGMQDECLQGIRAVEHSPGAYTWVHINAPIDDHHRADPGT